jgi:hypothetical protein
MNFFTGGVHDFLFQFFSNTLPSKLRALLKLGNEEESEGEVEGRLFSGGGAIEEDGASVSVEEDSVAG